MGGAMQGLTAALEALGAGDAPMDGASQVDLFAEPDARLPLAPSKGPSTGGRPKGARNRRTEEWVSFILGRYRAPLVVLAETWSRTPRELAEELGLVERDGEGQARLGVDGRPRLRNGALAEAYGVQQAAAIAALPYLHQRQPLAIQASVKSAGLIVIGDLSGMSEAGEGVLTLTIPHQQNQALSEADLAQSDGQQSDGEANSMIAKDNP